MAVVATVVGQWPKMASWAGHSLRLNGPNKAAWAGHSYHIWQSFLKVLLKLFIVCPFVLAKEENCSLNTRRKY